MDHSATVFCNGKIRTGLLSGGHWKHYIILLNVKISPHKAKIQQQ
jgi:hypothetical protein